MTNVVKFALGYDDFLKLKPDQKPKANINEVIEGLKKINPKIHTTDWFKAAKLTKFNPP